MLLLQSSLALLNVRKNLRAASSFLFLVFVIIIIIIIIINFAVAEMGYSKRLCMC